MSYVAVLPWVYRPYRDECLKNCKFNVMEVDNSKHNLGIMASHNLGIKEMRRQDADWLIIMSAAIRFGDQGGLDFIAHLDPYFISMSAASEKSLKEAGQVGIFGWHLIAFSRECIDKVGLWDCNFSPYGWDDIDYIARMMKAFPDPEYSRRTKKVACDVTDTTMAHSINLAGITADTNHHLDYIEKKWGVILHGPGKNNDINQYFDTPWNNPDHSLQYWPEVEYAGRMWRWNG